MYVPYRTVSSHNSSTNRAIWAKTEIMGTHGTYFFRFVFFQFDFDFFFENFTPMGRVGVYPGGTKNGENENPY